VEAARKVFGFNGIFGRKLLLARVKLTFEKSISLNLTKQIDINHEIQGFIPIHAKLRNTGN
jgi:hypothetical protein